MREQLDAEVAVLPAESRRDRGAECLGRTQWLVSHGTLAAGGTVAFMIACGGAAALSNGIASGDVGAGWGVMSAAVVQVPAILALGGFVFAGFRHRDLAIAA